MRIVLLGPPGSGKGTQGSQLAKRLAVPTISTGEILREAVRNETPLGQKAQAVMDKGELVSDELILAMIGERLAQADARKGFILDGFPRTLAQARAFETMLSGNGDALSAVLNFSVPEADLVDRMLGRAKAEGRADDRPETIRERMRVYREKTEPLVGFYRDRDLLADIDGTGSVEQVAQRVDEAVSAARRTGSAMRAGTR